MVVKEFEAQDLPEIQKQEELNKYRKEILAYKKRMVYLDKLLSNFEANY
jgi:hypothetical protein